MAVTASGYAYIANSNGDEPDTAWRPSNITNPASPQWVGFDHTPGHASGVAVAGNYAYIADGNAGLRIVNIANPQLPPLSARLLPRPMHTMWPWPGTTLSSPPARRACASLT